MPHHVLLDVFTDRPFTGNPLAVFVDPGDLSTAAMQALARELNLSESVFLRPPADAGGPWATRIFTPAGELPFAGHPTVGAAWALAAGGHLAADPTGTTTVVLREGVGDVPVEVAWDGDRPATCTVSVPVLPVGGPPPADPVQIASAVGLEVEALHPALPLGRWSAGVPFVVVPVRDLDALASARPLDGTHGEIYAVTPIGDPEGAVRWRARMFAPGFGIPEDPATGAAAAAFAGYLAEVADGAGSSPQRRWTIEQGVEMGRPSRIEVVVERDATGSLAAVRIAGTAVAVGEGRLDLPPDT
ncbi:PhzF family phenazine biosynthesis protein [Actinomarinicola tropica]|uniref:PhzF family phenazine biosynthesis protein n=1 Tax=Actinomarinicola tropica TaxID=2789776 RepID=UPI0018979683|nr:PhzF family phenazine biosynthesis protein [Actinomarinicola tropica]